MTKRDKFFTVETGFRNNDVIGTTQINYSGYGYGSQYGGMTNLYGYDPDGNIYDYIVTYHRSLVICKLLKSGDWWDIDEDIRDNYSTNGYTTRVGIRRASIARCRRIARSHQICSASGKDAHDYRVQIRN